MWLIPRLQPLSTGMLKFFFKKSLGHVFEINNRIFSLQCASKYQRPEAVEPAGLVTSSFSLPG